MLAVLRAPVQVLAEAGEIAAALAPGWSAPHRTEIVEVGGVLIVDDSYHASPVSTIAALELLKSLPGRHVAVLGELLELGDEHTLGHCAVGRAAAEAVALPSTTAP